MSVYKPKNSKVWLYDFQRGGVRFHGSTGCTTRKSAETVEERKRAEVALDDGKRKKKPITLDDAAGIYEDRLKANGKWSKTTEYIIIGLIESLRPNTFLSDISQADLSAHFAKRAGMVSASTVNREIDVARPIWRRVMKTHDIGDMPEWGELRYAVADKDPRELYRDEETRLFEVLRPDFHDFARFTLLSGWRLAEVRHLRWVDLNLGERIAETKIKGGNTVKRPLTQDMLVIIANQKKVGPFVFTYVCAKSRKAHTDSIGRKHVARLKGERYPFTQWGWRRPWDAALKEAGIPSFRFHDLRHTRGTRILRATGNLALAKEALKHRSIKTTLRYAHAADEDVRRGLEASESRSIPETPNENAGNPQKSGIN